MNRFGTCVAVTAFALVATPALAADDATGWSGEVNAAIALGSGTTRTFSGNVDGKATRTWENDVASVRARGDYGVSEGKNESQRSTQNSQGIYGEWKHVIHERFFWDTKDEVSRDVLQNREVRVALSTGPGYRFWQGDDAAKQHFDTNAGLGYRFEIYDGNTGSTISDNGDTDHFADAIAGFEYKNLLFEDRIEFTHTGLIALPVNDPNAFIARTEAIVGIPLTESWSFRIATLVEYTNDVPDDVQKLRTISTLGLGYKF